MVVINKKGDRIYYGLLKTHNETISFKEYRFTVLENISCNPKCEVNYSKGKFECKASLCEKDDTYGYFN